MADFVEPEILNAIWAALNTPERRSTVSDAVLDEIARSAWIDSHRLEDLLHGMDRRIDYGRLGFEELTKLADIPVRLAPNASHVTSTSIRSCPSFSK